MAATVRPSQAASDSSAGPAHGLPSIQALARA
jgi:hypothetical protein